MSDDIQLCKDCAEFVPISVPCGNFHDSCKVTETIDLVTGNAQMTPCRKIRNTPQCDNYKESLDAESEAV